MSPVPTIDPDLAFRLIIVLSWMLVFLGVLKLAIYLVGECLPGAYARVKSETVRKFLTGTGNKIVFGLLGLLTVLAGFAFLGLGYLVRYLFSLAEKH